MKIGVIADDFTGASDVANSLSKAGARTVQYIGIPPTEMSHPFDAAVISLKTRSAPVEEAVSHSLAACRWLVANGAEQIVFKYCSTFDSTPEGNIGPVAGALMSMLDVGSTLVCPAFPANGRTVYNGHLFVNDRLLNESGMEKHPLTPMIDPDIRRWLQRQTDVRVGHISLAEVRKDASEALTAARGRGEQLIVADAIEEGDLALLGAAMKGWRLVTGGSAIAKPLPANFGIRPREEEIRFAGSHGPAVVLSGSCSAATRQQISHYKQSHPALRIEAADLVDREATLERVVHFIETNLGAAPLVYSSSDPSTVAQAQTMYGRDRLAASFDAFFAELARKSIALGARRLVAAGGETSGAVAAALGRVAFEIGPEIAIGVPALIAGGGDRPRIALALKSGNFGQDDFFQRALEILGQ